MNVKQTRNEKLAATVIKNMARRHTGGVCHNCNSPQCICNYVHIMRNSYPAHRHSVVLMGKDLGY